MLSLSRPYRMSELANTQPVSAFRRATTALSQWIDSAYCPDGADKMRAEPDKVELRLSGRIRGDIVAPRVSMVEGSFFRGRLTTAGASRRRNA